MNWQDRFPWLEIHSAARTAKFWFFVVFGVVFLATIAALSVANYRIGFSNEGAQSVGSAWTFVRLHRGPVAVGKYGVFTTDRRVKRFPTGTEFVKLIVGKPGDLVHVGAGRTTVNGHEVAGALDSLQSLGLTPDQVETTYILAPGDYFAVGTRPHSYDSRYWGPVHVEQFVGTAILL